MLFAVEPGKECLNPSHNGIGAKLRHHYRKPGAVFWEEGPASYFEYGFAVVLTQKAQLQVPGCPVAR